jgi:hypothetical protein
MGRVSRGIQCSVKYCEEDSVKSVSKGRVAAADFDLETSGRRVYLCKDHWKELKKATRRRRNLERVRWG